VQKVIELEDLKHTPGFAPSNSQLLYQRGRICRRLANLLQINTSSMPFWKGLKCKIGKTAAPRQQLLRLATGGFLQRLRSPRSRGNLKQKSVGLAQN
jgi:hypothetical protein